MYAAEISRGNPTCLLFVIDQSGSMAEPFGAQSATRKADGVADAINRLLQNLVLKCAKADGVRDYFHVGVLGYGGELTDGGSVKPALAAGPNAGQALVPISTIADHPLRVEQRRRLVEDGAGGLVEQKYKFPVWFEPVAHGKTPMCKALDTARGIVAGFLRQHPNCFPPIVMHLTDGKPSDGDPRTAADAIRHQKSSDGPVLLFNAHLSARTDAPFIFPEDESALPDNYAKLLFRMSSELPEKLQDAARSDGFPVGPHSRGFVFNADLVAVIRFLDLGTRVASSLR